MSFQSFQPFGNKSRDFFLARGKYTTNLMLVLLNDWKVYYYYAITTIPRAGFSSSSI